MSNRLKYMVCTLILASICLTATAGSAAELQLAGIKLGRDASTILQKYGNPTEIRVGGVTVGSSTQAGTAMASGMPGMPTMPGMIGAMPGSIPGAIGAMPGGMPPVTGAASPGGVPSPVGGTTGVPSPMGSLMPGAMPMMPTMPGMIGTMPGMTGAAATTKTTTVTEVTWVYKFTKNRSLEFVINSKGRILQISAYGASWPGIATSNGITLGNTYKDIIRKYGWPENHETQGSSLIVKYPDTHRVQFTLVDQTIVGITIALMD